MTAAQAFAEGWNQRVDSHQRGFFDGLHGKEWSPADEDIMRLYTIGYARGVAERESSPGYGVPLKPRRAS